MAKIEIQLPKMGESVTEATIVEWLKNEGETIEEDEFIVNIATDKVDNEVPSPVSGKLVKKLFNKDEVVQVGEIIGIIETEGENGAVESKIDENNLEIKSNLNIEKPTILQENIPKENSTVISTGDRFYSPLVKSIALQESVSQQELDQISGSGASGRVTKKDILEHLENRKSSNNIESKKSIISKPLEVSTFKSPKITTSIGDEIIEMDRMRKLIADHMVMSKRVSPHVTSFVEADVTNIVLWRNRVKKEFELREGEKLTFTPIFIEAVVKAIKDFPNINASVDESKIILKKAINIGMATALPSGNLIVPVIHNADSLNLVGLCKKVNDLAKRARENKLTPEEISGGTYTVTNVGSFGNLMGTPIINQPQVAILALGAIKKKPAVIETPTGDLIGIRHQMILSHSYDHRVVDGALGGSFVRRVADYLENFDVERGV